MEVGFNKSYWVGLFISKLKINSAIIIWMWIVKVNRTTSIFINQSSITNQWFSFYLTTLLTTMISQSLVLSTIGGTMGLEGGKSGGMPRPLCAPLQQRCILQFMSYLLRLKGQGYPNGIEVLALMLICLAYPSYTKDKQDFILELQ